jgi:hypothetical protein
MHVGNDAVTALVLAGGIVVTMWWYGELKMTRSEAPNAACTPCSPVHKAPEFSTSGRESRGRKSRRMHQPRRVGTVPENGKRGPAGAAGRLMLRLDTLARLDELVDRCRQPRPPHAPAGKSQGIVPPKGVAEGRRKCPPKGVACSSVSTVRRSSPPIAESGCTSSHPPAPVEEPPR